MGTCHSHLLAMSSVRTRSSLSLHLCVPRARRWPGSQMPYPYLPSGPSGLPVDAGLSYSTSPSNPYGGNLKANLTAPFRTVVSGLLSLRGPLTQQQGCPSVRKLVRRCSLRSLGTLLALPRPDCPSSPQIPAHAEISPTSGPQHAPSPRPVTIVPFVFATTSSFTSPPIRSRGLPRSPQ